MTINATAVWRVRPSGNNLNGGGFDSAISGAGTDYSQQNAAQLSGTTSGVATGTTNFNDASVTFTSAMIGNAINIASGTGFTAGFYFVTAFVDSHNVTLDRSPGTGSNATWKLGGGWADWQVNTSANIVPGNIVYILGSGMPNPASYVYDYSPASYTTPVSGDQSTGGLIRFIGDPNTPSGGYPTIQSDGLIFYQGASGGYWWFEKLWFIGKSAALGYGHIAPASGVSWIVNCISDQFGYDCGGLASNSSVTSGTNLINCEVFSSVAKRTTNAQPGVAIGSYGTVMYGCNIHDCIGPGVKVGNAGQVSFNVIAKNGSHGVIMNSFGGYVALLSNNTIDNNLGDGINFATQTAIATALIFNNIISNHTGVGTYGMNATAGSTAQNDRVKGIIDYNTYYNNTTNANAISLGAHATTTGTNPFVDEPVNDFSLVSAFYNAGVLPATVLPQNAIGWNG